MPEMRKPPALTVCRSKSLGEPVGGVGKPGDAEGITNQPLRRLALFRIAASTPWAGRPGRSETDAAPSSRGRPRGGARTAQRDDRDRDAGESTVNVIRSRCAARSCVPVLRDAQLRVPQQPEERRERRRLGLNPGGTGASAGPQSHRHCAATRAFRRPRDRRGRRPSRHLPSGDHRPGVPRRLDGSSRRRRADAGGGVRTPARVLVPAAHTNRLKQMAGWPGS